MSTIYNPCHAPQYKVNTEEKEIPGKLHKSIVYSKQA